MKEKKTAKTLRKAGKQELHPLIQPFERARTGEWQARKRILKCLEEMEHAAQEVQVFTDREKLNLEEADDSLRTLERLAMELFGLKKPRTLNR